MKLVQSQLNKLTNVGLCILIILGRSYYKHGPRSSIIRLGRGHWAEITEDRAHWHSQKHAHLELSAWDNPVTTGACF